MNSNNLPRGQLSTIILFALVESDKYGFEILTEIKEKSNCELIVKQPTLYSALSRMEKQGFITSYWQDGTIGGKRHYYRLTDLGKKQIQNSDNPFSIKEATQKPFNQPESFNKPETSKQQESELNLTDNTKSAEPLSENRTETNDYCTKTNDSSLKNTANAEPNQSDITASNIQQNSFLNTSSFKIQSLKTEKNDKPEKNQNQINIFEKNVDLTRKKFNIEQEIKSQKPENLSFSDKIKCNQTNVNYNNQKFTNDVQNTQKNENFTNNFKSCASDSINIQDKQYDKPQDIDTNAINEKIKLNQGDDAVFVTTKYKPDEMPKVKTINPLLINDINKTETIKLEPKVEYGYTEMINSLYKKSTQKDKNIFASTAPTFPELKDYYEKNNIKFFAFKSNENQKNLTKPNVNYVDYNKANLKKFLILFVLIFVETLSCFLIFDYFNLKIEYIELFFILPAIFLLKPIYYFVLVLNGKSKIITEFKVSPLWLDLVIVLVGIVLLYSINMLFGLTYANILEYATTFIFPSILLLNFIFVYIIDMIIFKKIRKV